MRQSAPRLQHLDSQHLDSQHMHCAMRSGPQAIRNRLGCDCNRKECETTPGKHAEAARGFVGYVGYAWAIKKAFLQSLPREA